MVTVSRELLDQLLFRLRWVMVVTEWSPLRRPVVHVVLVQLYLLLVFLKVLKLVEGVRVAHEVLYLLLWRSVRVLLCSQPTVTRSLRLAVVTTLLPVTVRSPTVVLRFCEFLAQGSSDRGEEVLIRFVSVLVPPPVIR